MSRDEFNWFNVRTSGEEVADEEWEVVEGNTDLQTFPVIRNFIFWFGANSLVNTRRNNYTVLLKLS